MTATMTTTSHPGIGEQITVGSVIDNNWMYFETQHCRLHNYQQPHQGQDCFAPTTTTTTTNTSMTTTTTTTSTTTKQLPYTHGITVFEGESGQRAPLISTNSSLYISLQPLQTRKILSESLIQKRRETVGVGRGSSCGWNSSTTTTTTTTDISTVASTPSSPPPPPPSSGPTHGNDSPLAVTQQPGFSKQKQFKRKTTTTRQKQVELRGEILFYNNSYVYNKTSMPRMSSRRTSEPSFASRLTITNSDGEDEDVVQRARRYWQKRPSI